MRRILRSLVVLGAIAALAAPAGAANGTRVEKFTYNLPGQVEVIDDYGVWMGPGCAGVKPGACFGGSEYYVTKKSEKAVSVKIVDLTGASVKGVILQKGFFKEFCGTSGRVPITGGKPISIFVSANPCAATPDGVPTTGTVSVKFSK